MAQKKIVDEKKFFGYLEGWLSVAINTFLFALKFWAGARIGSIAMVADSWHTLSDSLTSLIVVVGFWLSTRPADEKHHFGHGRAESVASIVIGTILAVVGVNFLKESIDRLLLHQSARFESFAIIVFSISMVIKEGLAQFSSWAGKKVSSHSLAADAWHHRSDAIASGLIVVGAFSGEKIWWIDGAMGIGVSILILYVTYTIVRKATSYLLGESPTKSLERQISETLQSVDPDLNGVHHIHVHHYGEHLEITAHIRVPPDMNVDDAHHLVTKAESLLKERLRAEITLHMEPGGQGNSSKK